MRGSRSKLFGSKAGKLERTDSQATSSSTKSSNHSVNSVPEPSEKLGKVTKGENVMITVTFDSIDDAAKRKAKMHKTLGKLFHENRSKPLEN